LYFNFSDALSTHAVTVTLPLAEVAALLQCTKHAMGIRCRPKGHVFGHLTLLTGDPAAPTTLPCRRRSQSIPSDPDVIDRCVHHL
jgi:DNA topoisomerase VI subunit A